MAKKVTPKTLIKQASEELSDVMRQGLSEIAASMIKQVMVAARQATPATMQNAIKDLSPTGAQDYKRIILELFGDLAWLSINMARKEIPGSKKVRLAEEFDDLPPALKKKLKVNADFLVSSQIDDLTKAISFGFLHNYDTTDSLNTLESDIVEAAADWIEGNAVTAGSSVTAATIVSSARDEFFDTPEVFEEIEAFEFVNEDPVTPICTNLAGTVFAKDDPDRFRYTPPLHWNCKSWIRPILELGKKEITKLQPTTQAAIDSIQFDEAQSFALRLSEEFQKLDC